MAVIDGSGGFRGRSPDPSVMRAERELEEAKVERDASGGRLEAARAALREARVSTDSHRSLSLPIALLGILGMAVLEVFAAEPAAETLQLSVFLTYVVTVILVVAVVGGAILLAHATGRRWKFLLGVQIFLIALLFVLRLRFLLAFTTPFSALMGAAGMTALTGVVYLITEELARRMEPAAQFRAKSAVKRAEREHARDGKKVAQCSRALKKAIDAQSLRGEE